MNNDRDLPIDREKKLILLGWLKRGVIDGEELDRLHSESRGEQWLTMDEAREFIRQLEEKNIKQAILSRFHGV